MIEWSNTGGGFQDERRVQSIHVPLVRNLSKAQRDTRASIGYGLMHIPHRSHPSQDDCHRTREPSLVSKHQPFVRRLKHTSTGGCLMMSHCLSSYPMDMTTVRTWQMRNGAKRISYITSDTCLSIWADAPGLWTWPVVTHASKVRRYTQWPSAAPDSIRESAWRA